MWRKSIVNTMEALNSKIIKDIAKCPRNVHGCSILLIFILFTSILYPSESNGLIIHSEEASEQEFLDSYKDDIRDFYHGEGRIVDHVNHARRARATPSTGEEKVCQSENFCKNQMLRIPNGYNFFEIPFQPKIGNTTPPINVTMKVRIERIRNINEVKKEITLDMEITLGWTDWKILAFRRNLTQTELAELIASGAANQQPKRLVTLNNPQYLSTIWKPNLYIYDLIEKSQPKLMSDLITLQYDPDGGFIFYLTRVILTMSCPMEFQYFPTDTYKFTFQIRGFSYNENLLNLQWFNPPFLADRDQSNFDIQLDAYSAEKLQIGNERFNLLRFTLLMRRKLSYHVVQTFIPTYIFLFITWLCFLIPSTMTEVRVGICMTTLLSLTAMQSRETSPNSAYVKALDIWMVTCVFSVFLTLLQFALLTWLLQMKRKLEATLEEKSVKKIEPWSVMKNEKKKNNWTHCWETELQIQPGYSKKQNLPVLAERAEVDIRKMIKRLNFFIWMLERFAFYLFFVVFFVFNVVYWTWLIRSSGFLNWPEINMTYNAPNTK